MEGERFDEELRYVVIVLFKDCMFINRDNCFNCY